MVGAIAPSSRGLACAMAREAREAAAVVELGAGTGAVTRALVHANPARPLLVFERSNELARGLRRDFPQAEVIADCFHLHTARLAGLPDNAALVSSLPFRSLPPEVANPTIAAICAFLAEHPARRLVQYTYQPRSPFVAPSGFQWQRRAQVVRNIPPAGVWVLNCTRLA